MHPLLRAAADVLDRAGFGQPAFNVFQRIQGLGGKRDESDPLLPPPYLRVLTSGVSDIDVFVRVGRAAAKELHGLACKHGFADQPDAKVLEFGAGCGRVARWWIERSPAAFHGCDIHPKLVAWCQGHLAGDFRQTKLDPPTPYEDGAFDLVYALSVFTHMHEANASAWLAELARIVRPGGLALLTFLDDQLPAAAALQPALGEHGFAIRRQGAEGGNLLSSYFTAQGFAQRAQPAWRLLDHVGSAAAIQGQAVAVFIGGQAMSRED